MGKQTKKRTVASFLSDRMKQQVNENYDYLEENTRRVQPSASEEEDGLADKLVSKVDERRTIQGASSSPVDGLILDGSRSLDQPAGSGLVKTFTPEVTISEPAQQSEEILPAGTLSASENQEISLKSIEPAIDQVLSVPEEKSAERISKQEPIDLGSVEILDGESRSDSVEKSLKSENLGIAPLQSIVEVTIAQGKEVEASGSPFELHDAEQVASSIQIPAKLVDLLMTGKIPLRGIQIYLAMLRDAGFKTGGIATLSYNELATLTSIQTPHIPAILKSLVEMKLVERFRAEKTATSKNSYIIL